MRSLLSFLFSMNGFVTLALAAAIAVRVRSFQARAWRVLVAVIVFYGLASTHVAMYGITRLLAVGYAPLQVSQPEPGRTAIVLLGGGEWTVRAWDGTSVTSPNTAAAARVAEARRVYGLYPDVVILSSGGPSFRNDDPPSSGRAMKDILVRLGVPDARIQVEEASLNTREQALLLAPILANLRPARVVIVTSEVHMRRAIGAFRAVGVSAIPAIAQDPYVASSWWYRYLPNGETLRNTSGLAHEVVGLAYYAARGWLK